MNKVISNQPVTHEYRIELLEVLQMPEYDVLITDNCTQSNSMKPENLLQFSIPEGKLFYPEPFIASPSYLHMDLPFLHIFQYWYWLWFMFIFLICFFFISFLSVIRWCNLRTKPRRETRGVSRSKCGDLITACVPVSWAMSIIVNESTDAIDLNDGFGTAELVVGVRAYQWGWEYYYPKSIDLNYNLRSSYATFVGNSVSYTGASSSNVATNFLWRMYQNEASDNITSPAHALLIPQDGAGISNFLNFKDLGLNTLRESSAFAKIRNYTKSYSTNLVRSTSELESRYRHLSGLYLTENDFLDSHSFGVTKQHGCTSTASLGNGSASVMLDTASFVKFLTNSTGAKCSDRQNHLPTGESKVHSFSTPKDALRTADLLRGASSPLDLPSTRLLDWPTLGSSIDDNSDKEKFAQLAGQMSSIKLWKSRYTGMSAPTLADVSTSDIEAFTPRLTRNNPLPRTFNLSGSNSKVLLNDQSTRNLPNTSLSSAHLNFSSGRNSFDSNLNLMERVNTLVSPFSVAIHSEAGYPDVPLSFRAVSTESLSCDPLPAVVSTCDPESSSLDYDSAHSKSTRTYYTTQNDLISKTVKNAKSQVGDVFIGSREKTPKPINSAYWDTFWSNTNSSNRVISALRGSAAQASFSLPLFQAYVDYDFRNDQALDILEELFWENSLSGYDLYDYLDIKKNHTKTFDFTPKESQLTTYPTLQISDSEVETGNLELYAWKDLSTVGSLYGSGVQMEELQLNPKELITPNLGLLALFADLNDLDEPAMSQKQLLFLTSYSLLPSFSSATASMGARSYTSVFNSFRSDFVDFNWINSHSTYPLEPSPLSNELQGTDTGRALRLSNTASLRLPVRNSIITTNAFQKVFKARFDEGRAHVQAESFADLTLRQPFLADTKVPYLQTLAKNKRSFFEAPLYLSTPYSFLDLLTPSNASLNTPPYAFPFLSAKTSDTARFTWIDWFSKWKYIEIQPSSVSKYSTLGVPYLRKPFDFNSNLGDAFQETELYFTRIARSRRNYLSNWSYSPLNYNKSYVWNAVSDYDSFLYSTNKSLSSIRATGDAMYWYWSAPTFAKTGVSALTFSSSGNDIYSKSTWRPRQSIQSYYYNTTKLIDILSRREYLYRLFLDSSLSVRSLPQKLCATPQNPLFKELRSSFLFNDPASFGSEYSRDFSYGTSNFVKSVLLKQSLRVLSETAHSNPLNLRPLIHFPLFYLLASETDTQSKNNELFKSQFRPLRKGISSMLRLHATGAVAMPTEVRLQVLASSRDVIHSWAIPSAHVKIDCVPGYTSHRIMKFLLTGVYWGQCQEICGRYHHWMPIVVYFMKPDLFVLWCSHFVMVPLPHEHTNAAHNWFSQPTPIN